MSHKTDIRQAVIFAGGLGERLKPFTLTNPKPMFPVAGKPFIGYLAEQLHSWGIEEVIVLLGYMAEKVQAYLGDGSAFGLSVRYAVTPVEYDTQYRLAAAADMLEDDFLMLYCDNLCPVNFRRLCEDYRRSGALIQFSAYTNEDGYTKNNLKLAEDGKVLVYDKKRTTPGLAGVDIGYAVISKKVLDYMSPDNENFEAVVYPKLVAEGKLYATVTRHRYYSIGSYERIALTEQFLSGQKYIFLDRDGVLNERPPKAEYITRPEDFIWLPGAKEAVKKLKDAGYFIILISNQAGIARGVMSAEDFDRVQEKMQSDLAAVGAGIDAAYYCPHGWDEGCDCRKPRPGMLYQAQREHSIDLSRCILIGDDERDIITAHNADMQGVLVTEDYPLSAAVEDYLAGIIHDYEVKEA